MVIIARIRCLQMATPIEVDVPVDMTPFESEGLLRVEAISQNGKTCVVRDMIAPRVFTVYDISTGKPKHRSSPKPFFPNDAEIQFEAATLSPDGKRMLLLFKNTKTGVSVYALHVLNEDAVTIGDANASLVAVSGDLAHYVRYKGAGKFEFVVNGKSRSVTYAARFERPHLIQFFHDSRHYFVYWPGSFTIAESATGTVVSGTRVALGFEPTHFWLSGDDSTVYLYSETAAHKFEISEQFVSVSALEASISDVGAQGIVPLDTAALVDQQGIVVHARDTIYSFAERVGVGSETGLDELLVLRRSNASGATLGHAEYVARPGSSVMRQLPSTAAFHHHRNTFLKVFKTSLAISIFVPPILMLTIPFAIAAGTGAIVSSVRASRERGTSLRKKEARAVVMPETFYASAVLTIETGVLVATTTVTRHLYVWHVSSRPNNFLAGSDGGAVPTLPPTNKIGGEACYGCGSSGVALMEDTAQQRPFCDATCQRMHYESTRRGTPHGEWIVYED